MDAVNKAKVELVCRTLGRIVWQLPKGSRVIDDCIAEIADVIFKLKRAVRDDETVG